MEREEMLRIALETSDSFHISRLRVMEMFFENGFLFQMADNIANAEREACAKVCDNRYLGDRTREDMEAKNCAGAIRARGKK